MIWFICYFLFVMIRLRSVYVPEWGRRRIFWVPCSRWTVCRRRLYCKQTKLTCSGRSSHSYIRLSIDQPIVISGVSRHVIAIITTITNDIITNQTRSNRSYVMTIFVKKTKNISEIIQNNYFIVRYLCT